MEPVEIEILLKGSDGVKTSVDELKAKLKELIPQSKELEDSFAKFEGSTDFRGLLSALERYKSMLVEIDSAASAASVSQRNSVKELQVAYNGLNAERAKAAASGDTEAVAALDVKLAHLKEQMDSTTQSATQFALIHQEARDKLIETEVAIERCQKVIGEMGSKSDDSSGSVGKLGDALGNNADKADGFAGSVGGVVGNLKNVPGPIGQAVRGVDGLTKASLRFIATPVGIVLAAISAALAVVYSWFTRTEKGQNALAVGSAYFTQVLESVLDVADKVGEWLFMAFTKPKEAATDLVNFVKNQVINRLTAMGEVAKGIMMILNGEFSAGFKQMSNGWLQSITGIKDVTGKIAAFADETNKKAITRMDITRRQNQLDKDARDYTVQKAKTEAEIAKLRAKGQDTSVSGKERQKALKEASRLSKEMYDQEISFARRKYEIIRDTNALSNSNKADKQKEAEAEAEIYRLEARRDQALGGITRKQNSAASAASAAARKEEQRRKKEEAERERQRQMQEKLGQELADLQRQNDAAEIAAMQEGREKKLREIANEYQARKNAIDKQEAEWKRDNKKAGIEIGENGLTADQTAALARARELNENSKAKAEQEELDAAKRAWNEYLIEYGTWQEKRQALADQYAEKIKEAKYEGEKNSLQRELDKKLKELKFDEFKAGIDFAEVFGNIDTQSVAALTTLRDKLKEYISKAAKDLKPDDLKALREALTKIDLKITERNPFDGFKRDLEELKESYKSVEKAQEDLNTVMDGGEIYVEEYDKATGKVVKKLLTQEMAERRLAKAQSERFTKLAEATQSLHAGVQKAREYGEAAGAVMDMLTDFGVQMPDELNGIISGYGQVLDGLESIDLTKPASIITGAVKTLAGVGKVWANVLSLGGVDFGGQKSIKRYEEAKANYERYMAVLDKVIDKQKQLVATMNATDYLNADNSYEYAKKLIQNSEDSARKLGRQYLNSGASKGFLGIGSSASKGVDQRKGISGDAWAEFNALRNQSAKMSELGLSWQTLSNAASGRMDGLFDLSAKQLEWIQSNAPTFWAQLHDDTQKYLEKIIACGDEWEEIQNARAESLTKISFDSFYSSWLEKIKDMKSDVKDVADAMEEDFQNAILTSMVEAKYREQLKALYNKWADMMESGGTLDDAEIEALRKERDRIAEEAIKERSQLAEVFGWKDESTTTQSGKAGGFNAMSQDQGTKLEGLFVSGQMHWASIDEKMVEVSEQLGAAGDHLRRIEENTGSSAKSSAAILEEMKKIIRDGLKVK